MLLWLIVSIGTALSLLAIAVLVAMSRAERRTRRAFYRSLGYSEDMIATLERRKGLVAAQLAQIRQSPGATGARPTPGVRDLPSAADGGD
jgi:O-antigen ligase